MQIVSWTEFFKEEKDVYVVNVSGSNVSMTVNIGPDVKESISIKNNRKPINLTNKVSFQSLKNCSDLRTLVQRNPPALKVIDEEEYRKYFEKAAVINKTSIEQEIIRSNMVNDHINSKIPDVEESPKSIAEQREMRAGEGDGEDSIHPRIIGLCNQVAPHLDKKDKMPASDLLDSLQGIEPELNPNDFEYINGKGYYKVVKRWAASKMESENSEE